MLSNLFKKKEAFDFSELKTDVHSHLIPGIDDGVQSIEESIEVIKKFSELGYKKLITSPHIMKGTYSNTAEIINKGLVGVQNEVKEQNIDIEIDAVAEYYFDEHFLELINKGEILAFGDKYVLFEFSFAFEPKRVKDLIFQLRSRGYNPVLAHYERYAYYHDNYKIAQNFREQGVKIQLNLVSLSGRYGKGVKKQAQKLIDNGLVDLVSSDCHRLEHLEIIENEKYNPYFHKLSELDLLNREL